MSNSPIEPTSSENNESLNKRKTRVVSEMTQAKTLKRQTEVLAAISEMEQAGEKISFYSVQKRTGAARSFLYSNQPVREAIETAKAKPQSTKTAENYTTIIKALRNKVADLEKENKLLKASLLPDSNSSLDSILSTILNEISELRQSIESK